MNPQFPNLFSPVKLRHKELSSRIVFGPHTVNMSHEGLPGDRHFGYYRERARGGAAMIVVEPVPVHRTAVLTRGNFLAESDEVIPHFRRITEECHGHGTVMIHQIYHVGGHGDQDNSWEPYWSPSGMPSMHDPWGSHAVTEAEIEELIESFVAAAQRDKEAGFDGVEVYAAYNCLTDQFWSPLTNKRTDRWGGSLENRLRFAVEILSRIRKMAGEDFIIGLTVSGAEPSPGGLTIEDKQEILAYLDQRGLIDYLSCGTGSYLHDFSKIVPSFQFGMKLGVPDAAAYKQVMKHALVTAESRIKTPQNAEEVLAAGHSDLVSIVRAQIADPHLANKAREGRVEDIRPCISCNQLCIGRRLRDYWASCLVNPSVAREHDWDGDIPAPAASPRDILVVGGGPAGLETARVAAQRGHRVRLVERDGELGGQFRLAAGQPERGEIGGLLDWYRTQLEKLQVKIELRREMTPADILGSGADAVVLSTGSKPSRQGFQRVYPHVTQLPGAEQDNVCTVHDVLEGSVVPGTNVLLLDDIDGWWPASGTALHLAQQRHRVTIVTSSEKAAAKLDTSLTGDTTRQRFFEYGIEVVLATALESWEGNTATLVNLYTGDKETRDFDWLVLATTNTSDDVLSSGLREADLELHSIGDAVAARTAHMAIYEGRKLGLRL
jgi:2,4-dienoyl-CoA reductase-like NADH-dependent reductase (Old Yellow Enzyme family)/thioredoxin reductase